MFGMDELRIYVFVGMSILVCFRHMCAFVCMLSIRMRVLVMGVCQYVCMCVLLCVCMYVSMNVRHVRIWVSISVRYVLV